MSPPDERPSVPHNMQRPPSGSQRPVATSGSIDPAGFTMEEILSLLRTSNQEAIRLAQADSKLRVDTAVSLIDSKLDGAITQITKGATRGVIRWKALAALAASIAVAMGTVMGSCMNGYQNARFDAVEPAARAEQKV